MPVRKGAIAKKIRQQRAMDRFTMVKQGDWASACYPRTNIKRWADEDAYAAYFAAKVKEKAALQVALRAA